MNRRALGTLIGALALGAIAAAQTGGGSVYNGPQGSPAETLRQQRALADADVPPTLNSVFLDASVLLNVHADAYVATFGVVEEGPKLGEARQKAHALLAAFRKRLKDAGVEGTRVTTDFVAQNRVYGFQVAGNVATERIEGFEVKETVSVRCGSQAEVEATVARAAQDGIFDLIKVDYVLTNVEAVRARLLAQAAKVIQAKRASYGRLLGLKPLVSPQVYADRFNAFYPTDAYASYQAAEGDGVSLGYTQGQVVRGARKLRTIYYSPLSAKDFDRVINPVVTDPVIQCTLYLKLRYESGTDRRPTPTFGRAR